MLGFTNVVFIANGACDYVYDIFVIERKDTKGGEGCSAMGIVNEFSVDIVCIVL